MLQWVAAALPSSFRNMLVRSISDMDGNPMDVNVGAKGTGGGRQMGHGMHMAWAALDVLVPLLCRFLGHWVFWQP